jgi:alkylated DNA nucleotide flippase Atl1
MKTPKSWQERLAGYPHLPSVKPIPEAMRTRLRLRGGSNPGDAGGTDAMGTIATPSPHEVDEAMRQVPEGRLATVFGIGEAIAARHRASIGCTVTTAIFAHMAAHAAAEAQAAGTGQPTPWWRTLKADGELNANYPGGIEAQMAQLESEGHTVVQRGRRYFVEDFERKLIGPRKR